MPTPRAYLAAGVVGHVLYAVGGLGGGAGAFGTSATLEAYDPATDSWTAKAPMPTARALLAVGVVNGVLYAVGGFDGNAFATTVEAYDPVSNTWSLRAPMPTARGLLAVGVANGVLYAVGGYDGHYLATVEAYDPATNTWTSMAPMPTSRYGLAIGVAHGMLYAIGGYNGAALATVEAYDPLTNTWTSMAPMPTPRSRLAVGVIGSVLYAVGGGEEWSFTELATVEAYDSLANTWTQKSHMPTARSGLAAGVVNRVLYAVGGEGTSPGGGASTAAVVEAYAPAADPWSPKASAPTARWGLGVGVVNDVLYAVGGFGDGDLATVEAYDPATDTWTTKAPMPTARRGLGVGVIAGVLYAVGGSNGSYLATVEAYDPVADTWTTKASMPTARMSLAVGVIDGVLYAVGGYNGNYLAAVEAYDPATDTWTTKAPMPTARNELGVGVVNNVLYAVGGGSSFGLATVEAYDPATDTWTTKAPMPTARAGLAVGVLNGVLYAVGGGVPFGAMEAYEASTDAWSMKERMPTTRSGLGVGVANGVLHAVGGSYASAGVGWLFAIMEGYYDAPPRAASVAIVGTPSVGQRLTGAYVYSNDEGEREGTSTYRWLRDGSVLASATTVTYSVASADLGHALTFEVTPRTLGGTVGAAATSAPVVIVASAPGVAITTPTSEPTATITSPFLAVAGAASGAVTRVTWTTDRGMSGEATGTDDWQAEVPLLPGTNVITVGATDASGVSATDRLTVTVPSFSYYLAEGATGGFFDQELALANPNAVAAPVDVEFFMGDGARRTYSLVLGAQSRRTILVDSLPGLESTATSAVVTSANALPLAVERTMTWDGSEYGSHTEAAVPGPGLTWYFAEGSEEAFFETYLLLANPQGVPNRATVQFFVEGRRPVTKQYDLPPTSRINVVAGLVDDPPGTRVLAGRAFSMIVTFEQAGVAERAMYFGSPPFWSGGHASAGMNAPSTTWLHAEGATGAFFDEFLLLFNPHDTMATVTLRFLLEDGATVTRTKTVAANGRLTVWVEGEDPLLSSTALAAEVTSDLPIVSERSMYWTQYPNWYEGHNAFGVAASRTAWALAEGRTGGEGSSETYILLANPGTAPATVTVTYLREGGLPPIVQTCDVPAASRFTLRANDAPGLIDGERFGAWIESTIPIVVERAMYSNAASQPGLFWASGTDAAGTPIPPRGQR